MKKKPETCTPKQSFGYSNLTALIRYDARLAVMVKRFRPQIVVLAGWMHILSAKFLVHFFDTLVVNLHPALPGQFPGLNAIERAFHAKVEYVLTIFRFSQH